MLSLKNCFIIASLAAVVVACSPARSVLSSGKVVPKKQVRFGINYTINVATVPIQQTYRSAISTAKNLSNSDSVHFDRDGMSSTIQDANAAILAYCIDPITMTDDIYFRIGLGHNMDFGYRNSGGTNAVDMMYQFLGSNGNYNTSDYRGYYGSVGLQYAHNSYDLTRNPILNKLQKAFFINMSRQDLTVPLIFSKSWGPEERVGCISFGLLYSYTFVHYKLSTKNIYAINDQLNPGYQASPELLAPIDARVNFGSYGAFFNLKVGHKVVYFNFGLAAYYQNYGKFTLLGGKTVELKGWSFVPTYGVQFNILKKDKKKAADL